MSLDSTLTNPAPTRWDGVARDFRHAIAATEASVMEAWLFNASAYTGKAGVRRVANVGSLIKRLAHRVRAEGKKLVEAYGDGRFAESLRHQASRAGSDIGNAAASVGATGKQLTAIAADHN